MRLCHHFGTRFGQERFGFSIKIVYRLCEISVIELILWFPLVSKYNLLGKCIGCIVHRHTSQIRQNLSCCPVSLQIMECRFGCDYIVITVFSNFGPQFLRNWLIPRKSQLLMVDTHLDFQFLQALFISSRCKVIHICIRNIVGFSKETIGAAADDFLREVIKLLVCITHESCIQNMIIISPAVKPNQPESHQFLNLRWSRVNHTHHRLSFTLDFPVHKKQIRKYLDVIKYQFCFFIFPRCGRVCRFKLHLINQLNTVFGLMRTIRSKCQNRIPHVCHIVTQIAGICVLQYFVDKVDTGLSTRMNFFIQISLD